MLVVAAPWRMEVVAAMQGRHSGGWATLLGDLLLVEWRLDGSGEVAGVVVQGWEGNALGGGAATMIAKGGGGWGTISGELLANVTHRDL